MKPFDQFSRFLSLLGFSIPTYWLGLVMLFVFFFLLDWAPPDDDVFVAITGVMGSVGTYLYGRRMHETLAVWETDSMDPDQDHGTAPPRWDDTRPMPTHMEPTTFPSTQPNRLHLRPDG